jgi:hypothetical protein
MAESPAMQEQAAKLVLQDPVARLKMEDLRLNIARKKTAVASITAESDLLMPAQFDARRLFDREDTLKAYAELGDKKKAAKDPEAARQIELVAYSQNPSLKAFDEGSVDSLKQVGDSVALTIRARGELEQRRNAINRGVGGPIKPEDDGELVQGKINALSRVQDLREKQQAFLTDPNGETFGRFRDAYDSLNGHIEQLGKQRGNLDAERLGLASQAQGLRQQTFDAKQSDSHALALLQDTVAQRGAFTPAAVAKARQGLMDANKDNKALVDALRRVDVKNVIDASKDPNRPAVAINMKQETAEAAEVGQSFGKQFTAIQNEAMESQSKLARLDRMEQLLQGVQTGKLTPTMTQIAAVADSLGVSIDKTLPAKQAMEALSNEVALTLRNPSGGAGMPGALSDKDREFLVSMTPGLAKTPEGNQLIIDTARKLAKRSQDVAKMARAYRKQHGHFDEGFLDELQDFADKNPLFGNTPRASGGGAASSGLANVQNEADYNALPSGSLYMAPDGKTRRKQ